MKIYAFIPTRSSILNPTTERLVSYLSSVDIEVKLLINEKSIFEAYENGFKALNAEKDDIIIFCHDDIDIIMDPSGFREELIKGLDKPHVGFVGVAGASKLDKPCVWWRPENNRKGFIFHGPSRAEMFPTPYGKLDAEVLVLDGVFLATKASVLNTISMKKPAPFKGEWDFYDLELTLRAWEAGFNNYVVPIIMRHASVGELVGRESWHQNRLVFGNLHMFPLEVK
jgi:GT2 family glycosyltransferase